ncbi:hypothetical protein DPMN_167031 [Dreissena polymorpha]|uniref:Uncharacterized protein n=1 Tax=Dreissena polymorpha TaxID=45954 RepID=A0A9D4IYE8_DREPO|nr:hypothetical protein DPMN_167031 [Dreissena polymorpha]
MDAPNEPRSVKKGIDFSEGHRYVRFDEGRLKEVDDGRAYPNREEVPMKHRWASMKQRVSLKNWTSIPILELELDINWIQHPTKFGEDQLKKT